MKNPIYASTGAFIGMANGRNHRLLAKYAPQIHCDGFEFMLYDDWYADFENIIGEVAGYGLAIPVIHFDKCIGILLAENTRESVERALGMFSLNVWAAKRLGASKAVFHLWGGQNSDLFVHRSVAFLERFYRECDEAGVELLIENIPSRYNGPYRNWGTVREAYEDARFIYDTRFGEYHAEHDIIMNSGLWKRVHHIHVSSFLRGSNKQWGFLRPILHPGEGSLDFYGLVARMPEYNYSVTLESPVLAPDGTVDIEKLNASLGILYRAFGEKQK
jgi:sugar phosphate isomerase/epimerase